MAEKGEETGGGKGGDLEEEEGRKGVETDSQVVEEGGGRREEGVRRNVWRSMCGEKGSGDGGGQGGSTHVL